MSGTVQLSCKHEVEVVGKPKEVTLLQMVESKDGNYMPGSMGH